MKSSYITFLFVPLCFFSIAQTAESDVRSALLQKALDFITSRKEYAPYSEAIGDPAIAEKWIAYLEKCIAPLDQKSREKVIEEAMQGHLVTLQIASSALSKNVRNGVFRKGLEPVLTDGERETARLKWKHQVLLSRQHHKDDEEESPSKKIKSAP